MKSNKSKFLFVLVLAILLISLSGSFVFAQRDLEVEYPEVGGETITPETTLPEYVVYVFNFSLMLGVIIASAVLIYGGFRYLTSAGSPEAMGDAKSWAFGGILGLVLLLCSYLILTTVNPELLSPKAEPLEPTTGIYLINAQDEKLYYIEDIPKIPENFNPTKIKFLSPKQENDNLADPEKEELVAVFIYSRANWERSATRIGNDGAGSISDNPEIQSLISIRLLWQRPGIYLYNQEQGWETNSWPRFYQLGVENLTDFNDQAKSMKIVNSSIDEPYWTVLFEHVNFKGKCDFIWQDTASFGSKVRNDVSSIAILKVTSQYNSGEITFYDDQNCQMEGNPYSWEPLPGSALPYDLMLPPGDLDEVLSFMINGSFSILINTKGDLSGKCQLFTKRGCEPSLKGTSVYSWFVKPKRAQILPAIE